jgi:hypothetical protein
MNSETLVIYNEDKNQNTNEEPIEEYIIATIQIPIRVYNKQIETQSIGSFSKTKKIEPNSYKYDIMNDHYKIDFDFTTHDIVKSMLQTKNGIDKTNNVFENLLFKNNLTQDEQVQLNNTMKLFIQKNELERKTLSHNFSSKRKKNQHNLTIRNY